jgi:ankyrin repeat protein
VAAAYLALCTPASAQSYSDSYTFIKAVRDHDGGKVQELLSQPGSVVINTRDRSSGEGALHLVVRERDLAWLSFLLGKGARADLEDYHGNSPLNLAAQIGWIDGASLLIGRRAEVDHANSNGETPLIQAVHNRDVAMVRLLLSRGADPKHADSVAGYSALDYARQDGRATQIVKLLEAPPARAGAAAGPSL